MYTDCMKISSSSSSMIGLFLEKIADFVVESFASMQVFCPSIQERVIVMTIRFLERFPELRDEATFVVAYVVDYHLSGGDKQHSVCRLDEKHRDGIALLQYFVPNLLVDFERYSILYSNLLAAHSSLPAYPTTTFEVIVSLLSSSLSREDHQTITDLLEVIWTHEEIFSRFSSETRGAAVVYFLTSIVSSIDLSLHNSRHALSTDAKDCAQLLNSIVFENSQDRCETDSSS